MTLDRILVRFPNWVGDIMMSLPVVGALRRAHPDAYLVGMARPQHTELVERITLLDEVFTAAPKDGADRPAATVASIRAIRRGCFDAAVILAPSFEAAITTWLGGIPVRVGHATDHRALLLTHPVEERDVHRADGFRDLVAELGASRADDEGHELELTDQDRAYAADLFEHGGFDFGRSDVRPIFVNPAAAKRPRAWASDRFHGLAEVLADRHPGVPVLVHDHFPFDIGNGWTDREAIITVKAASLVELAAVIERCGVYVGNDSGPMHIAAGFGVPTVGIYGSSSPQRTSPRGAPHLVVSARFECSPCRERFFEECPTPPTDDERPPCLNAVSETMVLEAVDQALRLRIPGRVD